MAKIFTNHFRRWQNRFNNLPLNHSSAYNSSMLLPNGGITVVATSSQQNTYFGVAVCSKKDIFCNRTGRLLAIERMLYQIKHDLVFDAPIEILEYNKYELEHFINLVGAHTFYFWRKFVENELDPIEWRRYSHWHSNYGG